MIQQVHSFRSFFSAPRLSLSIQFHNKRNVAIMKNSQAKEEANETLFDIWRATHAHWVVAFENARKF